MQMENQATAPVQRLNTRSVHNDIETFLRDKAINSENTAKAYAADIRDFFLYMRGKEFGQLTTDDLRFEHGDILDYRLHLIEQEYGVSSVNRKMSAIKQVMDHLSRYERYSFLRVETFTVDKLKGEGESYGDFTFDEVLTMVELVKKQDKGMEKSILIDFAARTSFRLDSILEITWKAFEVKEDKVLVTVIGKGKKRDVKPIPLSLYDNLLSLVRHGSDKVFTLTKKTAQKAIRTLVKEMGLDQNRNLVFHSLKKVGPNWIMDTTGDIKKAAIQGAHKSIDTTYKHYINKNVNFDDMAGLNMGKEIDLSVLEGLTAEQLMLIIRQSNHSTKHDLVNVAKKMK
jgi:integrase